MLVFSKYISTRISIKKRKLFSKTRTPDRNVLRITSRVRTHEAVSERTRPRFIRTVSRCSCGRSFAFSTLPRFLLQANISSYSLLFCLARPAWPAQPARLFCLDCPLKVDYATTVLLYLVLDPQRGRRVETFGVVDSTRRRKVYVIEVLFQQNTQLI